MTIAHTLRTFLEKEHVAYEVIAHRHTMTSLRAAGAAHVPPQRVAKAVLLEEDLDRGHYRLAVVPASHRVQLAEAGRRIGRGVHLATEEDAAMLFADCEAGAIPALGPAYGVETIVESSLLADPKVCVEGGDHESLARMATRDFARLTGDCPRGAIAKPM